MGTAVLEFLKTTGFYQIFDNPLQLVMIGIACVLLYLAIVKKFEPLLLLPIAFGMLLTNLPGAGLYHADIYAEGHVNWTMLADPKHCGLLDYLYLGVKLGIYPCLIFMGVGAMTDFGPLIANPKSLILGAAAQLGIYMAYGIALILGFTTPQAASIGIIGGADGPTAILVTTKLAPELLGAIAVAAYSYMALVPVIQPPIMRALTTKAERQITMKQLRAVSQTEKIIFPIAVTIFVSFLVPDAAPLVGCLMLGNLFKESGVTDRLNKTAQNELINIVTIFLGISVGATDHGPGHLRLRRRLRGRRAPGQVHEPVPEGEDQPPHRLRRRVRGAYGGPCLPGGGPEGQARQLPAHARHGSQRGRRHRLGHRGGRVPVPV